MGVARAPFAKSLQGLQGAGDVEGGEGRTVTFVQREYPRYAMHALLSAVVRGVVVEGHTINVSRGGLCAMVSTPVPVGTDLMIDLTLYFEDGALSEPLALWSRVAWCTGINDGFQIGLSFVNVNEATRTDLEMFLRFLDQRVRTGKISKL